MSSEHSDAKVQDKFETGNSDTTNLNQNGEESQKKKQRKPRFIPGDHLSQFRELAKSGNSQEEICKAMKLDKAKFSELFYLLCQTDGIYYKIAAKVSLRKSKVKENGFMVSSSRLAVLGLGDIFTEGKELKFKRNGNSLVIDVVE